ncbi:hypothetical protein ACJX0J_012760 [Zea mays]
MRDDNWHLQIVDKIIIAIKNNQMIHNIGEKDTLCATHEVLPYDVKQNKIHVNIVSKITIKGMFLIFNQKGGVFSQEHITMVILLDTCRHNWTRKNHRDTEILFTLLGLWHIMNNNDVWKHIRLQQKFDRKGFL